MDLITKAKDIDTAIVRIHETGQSLQQDMHVVACSVLAHYAKHNDKRVVLKLLQAMPEMARVNALRDWLNAFGTMTIGEEDHISTDPNKKLQLANAIAKPFWKFKKEEAYKPLDMSKYLDNQLKALRKDQEKTGRDHSALIAMMQAAKVPANLLPASQTTGAN